MLNDLYFFKESVIMKYRGIGRRKFWVCGWLACIVLAIFKIEELIIWFLSFVNYDVEFKFRFYKIILER